MTPSFDVRPRAEMYIKNHLDVVPVEPRSKVIKVPGWQKTQFTVSDFSPSNNIGLRLGKNGLADVDLDCEEARAIADMFLPETGFVFGRASARASHYFYFLDPPSLSIKLMDPVIGQNKGGTIAELRCLKTDGSIGFQTVAPGSIHESTGEKIEFESGTSGIPQNADAAEVIKAVKTIGAACLFARYFPAEGHGRNDTLLAIAGILARYGWSFEEANQFNFAIYRLLWGSQANKSACTSEVKPTFIKFAAGNTIYGIPKLKELIDARVVDRALEWLGIDKQASKPVEEPTEQLGVDLEVADAIARDDMAAIWNMLKTLAAMPVAEYQINRAAIKAHFKTKMSLTALDEAVDALKPSDTNVKSSSKSLDPWEEGLHRSEKGKPMPVLINADMALRNHPQWSGVLAFDEFKQKIRVVKQPPIGGKWPRDWSDADDTNTAVWMQSNGIYVGRDIVSSAVQSVAATNQIHVVREYLNRLQWDGTPRIQTWLPRYLKTENTPVIRMIGERWLISAIARIMNPGCKCDYMMVLEGTQGLKKSTALKVLAGPEWFCDHSPDLHDKDAQMQLQGAWIIEWAELDSLRKSEVTAVKNFLSRQNEKFRPPYGRYVIEVPRQCVFAGTTNEFLWQKDDTGGRRFWPAACGVIDLDALARDRDQLWAEALVRFTDGAIWWPETKEEHEMLAVEQKARMETDLWLPKIDAFLQENCLADEKITTNEIIERCLNLSIAGCTHGDKIRVGKIMSFLGWQYDQERVKGANKHHNGYVRPQKLD